MYIPGAFFSTELFWSIIKWLMILGVWAVFAWGTWREDEKIRGLMLKGKLDERDMFRLMRTLHRRDMQIWLQLSLVLVVVAANDIQHNTALLPTDFFSAPAPAAPAPAPVAQAPEHMEKYDTILKKTNAQGLPFSDITEFNERNSKEEAYTDWLKQRYESWLVAYFYLQKCKQAGGEDYNAILHSLETELTSVNADKNVESNILTAANGSYKEMYADIPCDPSRVSSTKSLYDANMQQIKGSTARIAGNPKPAATSTAGTAR